MPTFLSIVLILGGVSTLSFNSAIVLPKNRIEPLQLLIVSIFSSALFSSILYFFIIIHFNYLPYKFSLLKSVGELCSKPDLEKEMLKVEVANLENIKINQ